MVNYNTLINYEKRNLTVDGYDGTIITMSTEQIGAQWQNKGSRTIWNKLGKKHTFNEENVNMVYA